MEGQLISKDPWTNPHPAARSLHADLLGGDGPSVTSKSHEGGNPDGKGDRLVVGMDEDDVRRLSALARERGKTIGEVLVELVRSAS